MVSSIISIKDIGTKEVGSKTFQVDSGSRYGEVYHNTKDSLRTELKMEKEYSADSETTSIKEPLKMVYFREMAPLLIMMGRSTKGSGRRESIMGMELISGQMSQFTRGIF